MNLTSPKEIAALLKENSLSPLKKFGQNFLCDENVVHKIADSMNLTKEDYVLEIGTGLGTLTLALASRAKKVVSVEIDRGLLALHAITLSEADNITIIEGDILKTDLMEICRQEFEGKSFAVCGNLPYYITSKIILMLLECGAPITSITAMVQKEVAQRLCCGAGSTDFGALSASCQYYTQPQLLFLVSHHCFYPMPEVDSAIIYFDLSRPSYAVLRENYVSVVRAAFAMRRKTIFNNLKSLADAQQVAEILKQCKISPKTRAQDLSSDDFCRLTQAFFPKK
ncbi:MAG: 16S rRNA (adenine(1518)-N(6)/adenine(1519)-N(6))-dimethyltransferase RsmA [Christensenellaceae bacterium]